MSTRARDQGARALALSALFVAGCLPVDEPCRATRTTTPVGWTEPTPLGSPEALFSRLAGTCQAVFRWNASGWRADALTVEPAQGQSTLTVTVALDSSSASWETQSGTGTCPPNALVVQGTVSLDLTEGEIVHQQPVTIGAVPGMTPASLSFGLEEGGWGSWVSIRKTDPESSLSMLVDMIPLARGCSGQMVLGWQSKDEGAAGRFATWSDTN